MRARNVVFTRFLADNQEGQDVLDPSLWPDVAYVCWQLELCPKTSRLHHQGYVEFVGQKTWSWIQANCEGLETAHFEQRHGSQADARRYCMKEESRLDGPYEYGERREQVQLNPVLQTIINAFM